MCAELHCLPTSGGLFDQANHSVMKMESALRARNATEKYRADKAEKEHKAAERLKRHSGT